MRRVVLDSNVLLSALATPAGVPGQIYDAWLKEQFEFVCSDYIVREFIRIAITKFRFAVQDVIPFVGRLYRFTIMVEPEGVSSASIPQNDRPVLGSAVAGYAEILVTGDKELLALRNYRGIRIITPRKFLEIL